MMLQGCLNTAWFRCSLGLVAWLFVVVVHTHAIMQLLYPSSPILSNHKCMDSILVRQNEGVPSLTFTQLNADTIQDMISLTSSQSMSSPLGNFKG